MDENKLQLQLQYLSLTTVQKGAYSSGIKVDNDRPFNIKSFISDKRKQKTTLKYFLLTNSFHSLKEYINTNTS
jgi:hypothetical protein